VVYTQGSETLHNGTPKMYVTFFTPWGVRRSWYTDSFTHRRFYTEKLLHRRFYTQKLLHTEAFTHRRFYTQTLLHHRGFYTQMLLHTEAFTLSARKLLHRHIYTQKKSQFYLSFWRSNLISCERVATGTRKSRFYLFLAIEPSFGRKGCAGRLEIAILPQFSAIEPHFRAKGLRGTP